jgi:hypothetical protein
MACSSRWSSGRFADEKGQAILSVRQMDSRASPSSLASIKRVHELKVQERAAPQGKEVLNRTRASFFGHSRLVADKPN